MWNAKNRRVTTWVADVDEFGFTIHINTWADTVLYGATAGWIVYPSDRKLLYSAGISYIAVV
jgi:hypothetical protein